LADNGLSEDYIIPPVRLQDVSAGAVKKTYFSNFKLRPFSRSRRVLSPRVEANIEQKEETRRKR